MESVDDVKVALSARSRTATLDQLANEGRKRVRLIRAEHVAQMISEAVNRTVEETGHVSQQDVERLVQKSQQEFKKILREREAEQTRAREVEEQLQAAQQELETLRQQLDGAPAASPGAAAAASAGTAPMSADVMAMMMNEIATLKASMLHKNGAPAGDSSGLADTLEKIAGSLNDRLDQFGKKIGISSAVEADAVHFDALFSKHDAAPIESNMDAIEVKQKTGGGIAANLERLKKLKGGGQPDSEKAQGARKQ
jgi:hypothetical protein